jgi:hypothetical protein
MPRRPLDQYETPPHYVEPLLQLVGPLAGLRVYEPCVGKWHIARFLTEGTLTTNDLDPACAATFHFDARDNIAWPIEPYDWTITNPPFSDELQILLHALRWSKNVAMLARLSFLEPTLDRGPFWSAHPPTDIIVLPRYSFRLNDEGKRQTDNVTCCWLVWRAGAAPCVSFSTWRPSGYSVAAREPVTHFVMADGPIYRRGQERAMCGALVDPKWHALEPTCEVCQQRRAEYEAMEF